MTFDLSIEVDVLLQGNPVAAAVLAKVWDKSLGKPSEENSAKPVSRETKNDWLGFKEAIHWGKRLSNLPVPWFTLGP